MESKHSEFKQVSDKVSFSAEERNILEFWEKIKAFETSLKLSEGRPEFTFYDGPPFATGLPHYGHLLAGTIKDVVTRYAHQTGHYVERRFGWDCHGLPIEFEIDQKLGIKGRDDVMKMGIDKYNAECRSIVTRYCEQWEGSVKRMGRWIDFKNDYKTMDTSFMESVWWVFSELAKKGLVYRGFKVMPYSTALMTPLSNFETGQNYKMVRDPSVVVSFPLLDEPDVSLLAWTTTPWTLPSNLALCVHPDFTYLLVKDVKTGNKYILAQCRLGELYAKKKPRATGVDKDEDETGLLDEEEEKKVKEKIELDTTKYEVLKEMKGRELENKKYKPLFPYFEHLADKAFRVVCDGYVTEDSGTGIVHQAPAFGEDDFRVCLAYGVCEKGEELVCPVDNAGRFTDQVKDFATLHVKEADPKIIEYLKKSKRLVQNDTLRHQYPFCWRSETPLIYKAVPSWFVAVEKIKDQLLASNEQSRWVPAFVKEKRFHNWLANARDWAVSRNRYWGTPIPVWMSEDEKETVFIGSVDELKRLSGVSDITDLHKDKIDHITIPSQRGPEFGVLRRVEEVFDCWFESGSMPYAQQHYPFENKERFEKAFPADFIAEGLDQTRGWFYTLMVISTALFGKPAFKNVIVNGLVLAADGKKMSKRLKNYPDPMEVVERCCADALRLYLINSPVVRAEPLRFQEPGVLEIQKKVFLPWFHAYRFAVENARRFENATGKKLTCDADVFKKAQNVMDKWIVSSQQSLIKFVRGEMAEYRLYTVVPRLLTFIDQLTNWYVRMNRRRLKASDADAETALTTLLHVLLTLTRLMAPFTPFLVELMYQNLKTAIPAEERAESVHYLLIPEVNEAAVDAEIETAVSRMQAVIEAGRNARDNRAISLKQPLGSATVVHKNARFLQDISELRTYVEEELNVKTLVVSGKVDEFIKLKATGNMRALGNRFGQKARSVAQALEALSREEVASLQETGSIQVAGETLSVAEVIVNWEFQGDKTKLEAVQAGEALIIVNAELTEPLMAEGAARELINRVQKLRKKAGLLPGDAIEVFYELFEKKEAKQEKGGDLSKKSQPKKEQPKKAQPKKQEKPKAEKPKAEPKQKPKEEAKEKNAKEAKKEAKAAPKEEKAAAPAEGDDEKKLGKRQAKKLERLAARKQEKQAAPKIDKNASKKIIVPLDKVIVSQAGLIRGTLKRAIHPVSVKPRNMATIITEEDDVNGMGIRLWVTRPVVVTSRPALLALAANKEDVATALELFVSGKDWDVLSECKTSTLTASVEGVSYTLHAGRDYFFSVDDWAKATGVSTAPPATPGTK